MNVNNPNGAVDLVSSLDNHIRETKRAIQQTFPNMNSVVEFSSTELNTLRDNLTHDGTEFDLHNNSIINVIDVDEDSAVEPRSYNDKRYFQISNNLSELKDIDKVFENLFTDAMVNKLTSKLLGKAYPVGSVFINATDSRNPNTYLGFGNWKQYGAGRTIIGVGTGTDVNGSAKSFSATQEAGEYSHTLTIAEMPRHQHTSPAADSGNQSPARPFGNGSRSVGNKSTTGGYFNTTLGLTEASGNGAAHNNLQPYIVAYMWQRIQD